MPLDLWGEGGTQGVERGVMTKWCRTRRADRDDADLCGAYPVTILGPSLLRRSRHAPFGAGGAAVIGHSRSTPLMSNNALGVCVCVSRQPP